MAAATAIGIAACNAPEASAAPSVPTAPPTINITDIPNIDSLPVCQVEDCSDQPGQVGVWYSKSTGNWYLERGESTWLIVDNTVTSGYHPASGPFAWEEGSYVGGYN